MLSFSPSDSSSGDGHGNRSETYKHLPAKDLPPTVLLVEDDEDNRLMLKLMLEIWKYRVLEAKNGEEAVELAEKEQPNIILMDVQMPDLDGFDAARLIRRSQPTDGVPIVFLSGCAQIYYRRTAFEAGGNEYLVKPIDFTELELTIKKYICQ